ncbi:MAG TPA: hypothetical protein VE912_16425 [Bacteroidales bacterium]|nr:hypothetical protein [Bacteroidales bacterium]
MHLGIMNIIEKRDYIHNHLSQANEQVIDEMFEKLKSAVAKELTLQGKLISRAKQAEEDIRSGNVYSREEIEQKTNNIG